ncbi:FliI/YscN family ATPase [Calycomorphotria hydatis]|uniref:Flagellum-specific ATP synthase n=1 Tax=Calycomorphotria hydatis TaxID=2528027 RepID=A0A517TB96_9PLAN|nr:FliI/YscN family ATPase [Calycomorphotria hydatis]QDT65648.1 Flagellum-specific ATP synthase [Calycomorphotria hydatis]
MMHDLLAQLDRVLPFGIEGRVARVTGLTAAVTGFPVPLGATCRIVVGRHRDIQAEVVGFQDGMTLVMAYEDLHGVRHGDTVRLTGSSPMVRVGPRMLGRVINARGEFIDRKPPSLLSVSVPLNAPPISPLERESIIEPLSTGIRAIDGFMTLGRGQRLGLFAGSGVGKSTLIGQITRSSEADVNVIVLVGERGREVKEFIERDLGPEGLARSVVVAATGDESALLRLRAAKYGTSIAEYFRDRGKQVLLIMDSLTRFAFAQREIGLSAGEPPATRGYPPSVFASLPRLLERSGRTTRGSITGLYTVLVEGDDTNEPISDTVRGVLDGHIMLTRRLAERAHWPAIDVPSSISRLMPSLVTPEHREAADHVRRVLAAHRDAEDLISIGAYQQGSNPLVDQAIRAQDLLNGYLCQGMGESQEIEKSQVDLTTLHQRLKLVGGVGAAVGGKQSPQQQSAASQNPTQREVA